MAKWIRVAAITAVVTCGMTTSDLYAQRGVGGSSGIAQGNSVPKIVSLSGKVQKVVVGPCENTTGPSVSGTHFLIKTKKGKTLNIHLGPTDQVGKIAKALTADKKVVVKGFRTKEMEADHYVAQSIAYGDKTVQLRDQTLRPIWAGGRGVGQFGGNGSAVLGRGRGNGSGANAGFGRGRGYGRGYGQQFGRGTGRGRGAGRWWQ